ncbi:DEAD/DEAH box helicase domain protein [Thermovibrio ammonificans HB-1]|uniref:DEAD/DEAH box helicase domain protein n=1 Tax=Thermovibrio ammonificans (strain DSM 15698 / JCM 12110 / HB-1) TaxID=648996 RepID=E8T5N7_THEA1|nr:DEAD/DEAH box helicase [Thermovibrio ammonificans]ADU96512.1 DEAD/DEAH box helicase domain protein [Thermovibrio ammonificans HB-1]
METIKILESSQFDGESGVLEVLKEGEVKKLGLTPAEELPLPLPFKTLNPLQTAFHLFYRGGNALISSPTSSGKSLTALLFWLKNRKGKFIYTAPTRALIWEKFKEFRQFFPSVGVRSGDVVEELEEITQEAVVCTYESLLAASRSRSRWFEEAGALVIDEVHVIRDPSRGAVIEEVVSYAINEGIPLLALSATIPGAVELAKWIEAELFIESEWRPVPLERKVVNMSKLLKRSKLPKATPEEKLVAAVEELKTEGKTLVFVPRKDLGWQALQVENALYGRSVFNETLPFEKEEKEGEGVAFHNADVPQEEREAIEREFKGGEKLHRLYATQTLAYGVNLPADSVVIFVRGRFDRLTMEYRFFPDLLTVMQMEGRAGRFGLSEKGYSFIVVSGASEKALERELQSELDKPFQTALSQGLSFRGAVACPNREKSVLSLMLLGPLIRYGSDWERALSATFSVKKNPLLLRELKEIEQELQQMGYITDGKPTHLAKLLVASFVSPYCYEEFTERLQKVTGLAQREPTTAYLYAVRPFIRRELNPKSVELFTGEAFRRESLKIAETIYRETAHEVTDNSEVLIFYAQGGFFPFKQVARPPGELSSLPLESSLLGQLLCRLNVMPFETVHRTVMMVRSGIPYKFALLGSVEGLGYMRGNALARAGKLLNYPNEIALINAIKEGRGEALEAVKEALSERYSSVKSVEKEATAVVKAVERIKFPLGNPKLLKFLASLFVGRRNALKLTKEEALEVLYRNVTGEKATQDKS